MKITRIINGVPMVIELSTEELLRARAEKVAEKHIHFYGYACSLEDCLNGYLETKAAITNGVEYIHTTQMCFLSTNLFEQGYRVFVHDRADVDTYEVQLGANNPNKRAIRASNNLFKLWESGEFAPVEAEQERAGN